MEHRNGSRIPARLNVSIWAGADHLGWYRTINLGLGGLAIRGRVPGLSTNSVIRILIETLGEGQPRQIPLRALVVYQNPTAAGLMWAGDDAGLERLMPSMGRLAA